MRTSAKVVIPRRSILRCRFHQKDAKTIPTLLCSEISTRIMGDTARATEIFRNAINRNPDNDQDYLSLSLLQLRENNIADAKQTLLKGQAHIPGSGKILWGLGLASALEGNTAEAAEQFEHAVELLARMARKLFNPGRLLLSNGTDRQSQRSSGPFQEQQRKRWPGRKPD